MDTVTGKEKLVVDVVAAHNLMPKNGEGSTSPFVEVEFENQRLKTQVKYKDLNPVWNEKLVFHIIDVADIPYRTIEVNVFNERRSSNSRNFLGKVRVSGSSIGKEGEEEVQAQLHTLDKRSLFSHVRGEISLKLYVSTREEVKKSMGFGNGEVVSGTGLSGSVKKNKKMSQQNPMVVQQQQQHQQMMQENEKNKQAQQQLSHNNNVKPVMEQNQGEMKPVIITTGPVPMASGPGGVVVAGGGGGGMYSSVSNEYSLKETS